jgi:hypothetical protein
MQLLTHVLLYTHVLYSTPGLSLPVRPKARGLAQHGGPPGWLEENDPGGSDFVRNGRSMSPALTDHTTEGLLLNEHKNRHELLLY